MAAGQNTAPVSGERRLRTLRLYVYGVAGVFAVALATSLLLRLSSIDSSYFDLARVMGRSFFEEIVAIRHWIAHQDAVYLAVSDKIQPNPYLEESMRSTETTDGQKLARINPAYFTRLIAEEIEQSDNVRIHITSLRPLRPENKPRPWEATALAAFENGSGEYAAIREREHGDTFRYMAPLRTEKSCMTCHARQGYSEGEVRGGISVSFPYAPFAARAEAQMSSTLIAHLLFFSIGIGVIAYLGRRLIHKVERIRTLEGLLPICSGCKKIRYQGEDAEEQTSWAPIEEYIGSRTPVTFSHGMCPECVDQYYPEYRKLREARKSQAGAG